MTLGQPRDALLSHFSAYRAETQVLVEFALVLAVIAVLGVAAYTLLKPILVGMLTDVTAAL